MSRLTLWTVSLQGDKMSGNQQQRIEQQEPLLQVHFVVTLPCSSCLRDVSTLVLLSQAQQLQVQPEVATMAAAIAAAAPFMVIAAEKRAMATYFTWTLLMLGLAVLLVVILVCYLVDYLGQL